MGIAVSIGVYAEIDSRRNISNKNNKKLIRAVANYEN